MELYIEKRERCPTYCFVSGIDLEDPNQQKRKGFLKVTVFSHTTVNVEWVSTKSEEAELSDDPELIQFVTSFYQAMRALL